MQTEPPIRLVTQKLVHMEFLRYEIEFPSGLGRSTLAQSVVMKITKVNRRLFISQSHHPADTGSSEGLKRPLDSLYLCRKCFRSSSSFFKQAGGLSLQNQLWSELNAQFGRLFLNLYTRKLMTKSRPRVRDGEISLNGMYRRFSLLALHLLLVAWQRPFHADLSVQHPHPELCSHWLFSLALFWKSTWKYCCFLSCCLAFPHQNKTLELKASFYKWVSKS